MTQKNSKDFTETELETLHLLDMWRHNGLNPLVFVHGYSELFLQDAIGSLNEDQMEVMGKIFHLCQKVINNWHEFMDFFYTVSHGMKFKSLEEIGPAEIDLLKRKIICPAQADLKEIGKHASEILHESYGTITGEQRESLETLHKFSVVAIQRWQEPINFFTR